MLAGPVLAILQRVCSANWPRKRSRSTYIDKFGFTRAAARVSMLRRAPHCSALLCLTAASDGCQGHGERILGSRWRAWNQEGAGALNFESGVADERTRCDHSFSSLPSVDSRSTRQRLREETARITPCAGDIAKKAWRDHRRTSLLAAPPRN